VILRIAGNGSESKAMKNLALNFLSPEERERIIETVKEAEKNTSAEIVPLIVSASHHYPRAEMTGALALALLIAIPATLAFRTENMWIFMGFFALAFCLISLLLRKVPMLKRFFISQEEMNEEVEEAALFSFYKHNLHHTRDQTGILIYITVFERKVHILADRGINDRVDPSAWTTIVANLTQGIRSRQPGEAICQAIRACETLIRHHFPRKPDDVDELVGLIIQD
jgi:putative membrane protein